MADKTNFFSKKLIKMKPGKIRHFKSFHAGNLKGRSEIDEVTSLNLFANCDHDYNEYSILLLKFVFSFFFPDIFRIQAGVSRFKMDSVFF